MFDEEPDSDPHGECVAEIHRLRGENKNMRELLMKRDERVVAWQERQARRMSRATGEVTEWSGWYECKPRTLADPLADTGLGDDLIPREWRPLFAANHVDAKAVANTPIWTAGDEAMSWLNETELAQGGANGPTIKLRGAILALVRLAPTGRLPALPEPDHSLDGGTTPFYTAEQMREYALAVLFKDDA